MPSSQPARSERTAEQAIPRPPVLKTAIFGARVEQSVSGLANPLSFEKALLPALVQIPETRGCYTAHTIPSALSLGTILRSNCRQAQPWCHEEQNLVERNPHPDLLDGRIDASPNCALDASCILDSCWTTSLFPPQRDRCARFWNLFSCVYTTIDIFLCYCVRNSS